MTVASFRDGNYIIVFTVTTDTHYFTGTAGTLTSEHTVMFPLVSLIQFRKLSSIILPLENAKNEPLFTNFDLIIGIAEYVGLCYNKNNIYMGGDGNDKSLLICS